MNVLVLDVGGSHVKMLAAGAAKRRKSASGPELTPGQLVETTKAQTDDWDFQAVSIGFPGPVLHGSIIAEPHNLGRGWVGFDFGAALGVPVKIVNDAAMQALGGYRGGKMLFIGLGTGLGTALVIDSIVEPMEIGHLPYRKKTYEAYVGQRALERAGRKKWRRHVLDVIELLRAALEPDEILVGGGNAKRLENLPAYCRLGSNKDAFAGGFRLWDEGNTATVDASDGHGNRLCSSG